jgi:LysR family transcriptional activator of nhaA
MYNFNHLYYFYITAKSGSVNAAAMRLRISQPSLSSQIKVLERALDLKLFKKVGRNNQLTPQGQVVLGYCRRMFETSEEMTDLLASQIPSEARRFSVGFSDELDRGFVSEVVNHFLKTHEPNKLPRVSLVTGAHDHLGDRLRFRELDAVLTPLVMIDPELENLEGPESPVALACSSKQNTNAASLKVILKGASAQWLVPSTRFKLRSETNSYFELNRVKGRVVFESDVIAALVAGVGSGLGVAFLPRLFCTKQDQGRSIKLIGPKAGYWQYRIWLSCHKQNQSDPLIQTLYRSFQTICKQAASG